MNTGNRYMILICAAFIGIAVAIIAGCMFDIMRVQGRSMEPEIPDSSRVVINRMAYFFDGPDAGDVVAFTCDVYSEDGESGNLIRRVVATSGDKVEIKNGSMYVNGKAYERFVSNGVYLDDMPETVIGKNRVFVMSDTGLAVLDSRDKAVGQLRTDELTGEVLFK